MPVLNRCGGIVHTVRQFLGCEQVMGALLLFGEKGIEYPAMPSYLSPFTIMIEGRVSKIWVLGQTSFLMSEACICLVTLSLVAIANHLLGPHWFRLPFQGREGGPRKN